MWMMEMNFYITRTADGLVHVQNAVMGYLGQHHVHSQTGFEQWAKETGAKGNIKDLGSTKCDCGLKAGQTKSEDQISDDMKPEWR